MRTIRTTLLIFITIILSGNLLIGQTGVEKISSMGLAPIKDRVERQNAGDGTTITPLKRIDSQTIYGYNAYSPTVPTGTLKLQSNNPGLLTFLTTIPGSNFLAGSAITNTGTVYSVHYETGNLVTWDTATGLLTDLGVLQAAPGNNWLGLTFDPVSNKMYGVSSNGSLSILYEINYTGLSATILDTIASAIVIGIAANGNGYIYGVEIVNDVFGMYNIATGVFTIIGPLGYDANYAQSLEFDYSTGKLYHAAYSTKGELRVINITNGTSEYFGDFEGSAEIDGIFVNKLIPIPVELTTFEAEKMDGGIMLKWITATELNNDYFEILRKAENEESYSVIGTVRGNGTTTEINYYSFMDNLVSVNNIYSYRLKQIDYDGTIAYSQIIRVNNSAMPTEFSLNQNYPNPFNPTTTISYNVSKESNINLVVTNMLGEEVAVLVNGSQNAGNYTVNFNAANLTSGVYFYTLNAEGINGEIFTSVKKMMFVK